MHFPPSPGDRFYVPSQQEVFLVASVVAKFEATKPEASLYLVATEDGTRWVLMVNEDDDGPPWIGVPPRGEAP